jgi:hypothetical protein
VQQYLDDAWLPSIRFLFSQSVVPPCPYLWFQVAWWLLASHLIHMLPRIPFRMRPLRAF